MPGADGTKEAAAPTRGRKRKAGPTEDAAERQPQQQHVASVPEPRGLLESLPPGVLDTVVEGLLEVHHMRSWVSVLRDMLALRATCKTLHRAVAPLLPTVEDGLLTEARHSRFRVVAAKPHTLKLTLHGKAYEGYTAELHEAIKASASKEIDEAEAQDIARALGWRADLFAIRPHYAAKKVVSMDFVHRELPPRFFGLSPRVTQAIRGTYRDGMTITQGCDTFMLEDEDFADLPLSGASFGGYIKFPVVLLMEKAVARYGSLKGVEAEQRRIKSLPRGLRCLRPYVR